jgi:hypothetical protein
MSDRNLEPTYQNQLICARRLLAEKGRDALNNPHAMIGRACGCGGCFCCAALEVLLGPHAVVVAGRRVNARKHGG